MSSSSVSHMSSAVVLLLVVFVISFIVIALVAYFTSMSSSSVSSSGVDLTLKLLEALPSHLACYSASWKEVLTTHHMLSSCGFLAVDSASRHPSSSSVILRELSRLPYNDSDVDRVFDFDIQGQVH